MLQSIETLLCATPTGQPLSRVSATKTSSCRNGGRGYSTRSGAADGARSVLGRQAKAGKDFVLIRDQPRPGRWSWERGRRKEGVSYDQTHKNGHYSQSSMAESKSQERRTNAIAEVRNRDKEKPGGDRGGDERKAAPKVSDRRHDGLKAGSREALMVDMCLRPDGASRAELREALGWKSDPYPSLVVACDKANVDLSVLRHGSGPFRYRGRYQGKVNPLSIAPADLKAAEALSPVRALPASYLV